MNDDSARLKALQTSLKTIDEALGRSRIEADKVKAGVDALERERTRIQKDITNLTTNQQKPVVSEHALLRHIERVYGINLEVIKASILTDEVVKGCRRVKTGEFYSPEIGCNVCVKNNVITTIIAKDKALVG